MPSQFEKSIKKVKDIFKRIDDAALSNALAKVFIISIFIQIVFGRLTFLRENVNLPKKFDKNLFSTPPKTQIPVTKVFIF